MPFENIIICWRCKFVADEDHDIQENLAQVKKLLVQCNLELSVAQG